MNNLTGIRNNTNKNVTARCVSSKGTLNIFCQKGSSFYSDSFIVDIVSIEIIPEEIMKLQNEIKRLKKKVNRLIKK